MRRSSRSERCPTGPHSVAEGDGITTEERTPGRLRQIRERWTLAAQNGLAVAAACGLATLVSPFVPAIFPAKYSFDSTFIQSIALNVNLRRADQNYEAAAQFYRFLHLENLPKLTALLTMAVFCVSMALAVGRNRLHAASVPTLAAVYGSAVLAAVYISPYSKEAPVLLCVVMMLVISRSRTYAAIAMTMFMMLYAIEFRLYWALVAAVFVLQAALLRRGTIKLWRLVAVVALGMAIIAVLIEISHGKSLVECRAQLNHLREGSSNAVSLISQYVPGSSVFIGYINSIVTLVFVIFPVPLVLLGSPQYLLSAFYIALMTVISVKALKSLSAERDMVLERRRRRRFGRTTRCAASTSQLPSSSSSRCTSRTTVRR